jgi:hypothetical protein
MTGLLASTPIMPCSHAGRYRTCAERRQRAGFKSNPYYPFEGLNPVIMAILAWLVLKERLPVTAWIGLALVCVGIGSRVNDLNQP